MPRRGGSSKAVVIADPMYNSTVVNQADQPDHGGRQEGDCAEDLLRRV